MKSLRSICVLGLERSGREAICSEMGHPISRQRQRNPRRYLIDPGRFPKLDGYVFTLYSDLSELKLDMPEREGLFVLKPRHIESLLNASLNGKDSVFFQLLENLYWLGVKSYVLAVTHMDTTPRPDLHDWFTDATSRFIKRLQQWCAITVPACIPLGMKDGKGRYENLYQRSSTDFLQWYKGISLMEALEELVSSPKELLSHSLWGMGQCRFNSNTETVNFQMQKMVRGKCENNSMVRLYPGGHQGSLMLSGCQDNSNLNQQFGIKVENPSSFDQTISQRLIISENATAQEGHAFVASVLFNSDIPDRGFFDSNPHVKLTLLGSQLTEASAIAMEDDALQQKIEPPLFRKTDSVRELKQNLMNYGNFSRMLDLSITTNSSVLIDLYSQDPDAGRILLWKGGTDGTQFFLGAGKIISHMENREFRYLVNNLANLDRKCRKSLGERSFLLSDLCSIYHSAINEVNIPNKSPQGSQRKLGPTKEKFDCLIDKAEDCLKSYKDTAPPNKLRQLIANERRHVLGSLEKLNALDLSKRGEAELSEEMQRKVGALNKKMAFVRKRISQPITHAITDGTALSRKEFGVAIEFYKNLSKGSNYHQRYDVSENCYSAISKSVHELVTNSVKHATPKGKLRMDIFVDPPKMSEIPFIKMWFQDNGILTTDNLTKIEQSERGLKEHIVLLENYGMNLSLCEQSMGLGTAFSMKIPVWYEKIPPIRGLLLEIAALLNIAELQRYGNKTGSDQDLIVLFIDRLRDSKVGDSGFGGIVSKLENIMKDWGCPEILERCKKVFEKINYPAIKMGYQSIRREFDSVKELIIKLQRNPLNYLIKEAHQKIRREDIRKRIQLPLTDNIGLEYRLQEYENFFLIQKALTWAFEELIFRDTEPQMNSCIDTNIHISETNGIGTITLSNYGIGEWEAKLLPLRTRLSALNVKSDLEDKEGGILKIIIPIWRKQ